MSNELYSHIPEPTNALTNEEKRRLRRTFGAKNLEREILSLCRQLYQVISTKPYDLARFCDLAETINRLLERYGKYTRGITPSTTLSAEIEATLYHSARFLNKVLDQQAGNSPPPAP